MDERDETKMPDGTDIMQVWFECNRDVFTFYDRIIQAARRTTPDSETWQPIETAPKFGDPIDIWGRYGRTSECVWGKSTYAAGMQWVHEAGYDSNGPIFEIVVDPTHWMPLRAAPTSDKGDA